MILKESAKKTFAQPSKITPEIRKELKQTEEKLLTSFAEREINFERYMDLIQDSVKTTEKATKLKRSK